MSEEFVDFLNKNPKLSFKYNSKKGLIEKIGPNKTLIRSFANSYRLFASGENISLRSLDRINSETDISDEWKDEFNSIRKQINDFLDEDTHLHIGENSKPLNRRYISDIFINGWIFHVKDPNKTAVYQKWMSNDFIYPALEQEFILTLGYVSKGVAIIADLCKKELNRQITA